MKYLEGKKTYICAVCLGFATVAVSLGWISQDVYVTLAGLLGAGGLAALRAAK